MWYLILVLIAEPYQGQVISFQSKIECLRVKEELLKELPHSLKQNIFAACALIPNEEG